MAESSSQLVKTEDNAVDRLSNLPDSVLCHILSFLPTKTTASTITLLSHRYLHLWKYLQNDRLSTLPDYLLYQILSFLPTKTSVSTISLLSHRYRNLWKHLEVLVFGNGSLHIPEEQPEQLKTFAAYVNAIFTLRKSRDIRKMTLACAYSFFDNLYAHSVQMWIRAAIGHNLQELTLILYPSSGDYFSPPLSLFTCPNLVSLCLGIGILIPLKHSSMVCLPSLKSLHLDICNVDVSSLDVLLSGCPILETLDLTFTPNSFSNIRMPRSLKTLKFKVENGIGVCFETLDAPNLKELTISHVTFSAVGDLHNVMLGYVDVFFPPGESDPVKLLLKLLRALSGIQNLCLGRSTIECLLGAPVLNFPKFGNLCILQVNLPYFDSSFLYTVLHKCHGLSALIIYNHKKPKPTPRRMTPQPTSVPDCLVSHLTFINFQVFQGFADEVSFAEYILRNGLVLNIMNISNDSLGLREKEYVLKKLTDIPKASAMCQLLFDSDVFS